MRIVCSAIFAAIALFCFPVLTPAQTPFATDPTPLERPAPLKTLKTAEAAKLCDAILKALTDNSFKVTNQDCDVGEFAAERKTNRDGELDKVVIWLERDFEKPNNAIKLYFRYGRFETLLGHPEPVRITTTPADEDHNVGPVKEALKSLKI
jgi:hypothetical protein